MEEYYCIVQTEKMSDDSDLKAITYVYHIIQYL